MKIIGLTEIGDGYAKQKAYVAIVSHAELQKVANKAGYGAPEIKVSVGDDYPIAEGHDFRSEITQAVKAMQEAYTRFAKVAPVAAQFAGVVIQKSDEVAA